MEKKFYLDKYIEEGFHKAAEVNEDFDILCTKIAAEFQKEWEGQQENIKAILETQKKAIVGYENETLFFKNKICEMLKEMEAFEATYPVWYKSLEDAIYHENWGLAGVAEWFSPSYTNSSSAKIIGENIYFMEKGRMKLKPQKISRARREQLIRAFLLLTPDERLKKDFHEVYMLDGTRVTVFNGAMTKENQDVIIFRRYVVPVYSFEEQVSRGTIPRNAIPLFINMVRLGYNCAFTGAPRTSKTTFLTTWQSYEDPSLEGVMVETDPEVPLHKIMPGAPVVQVLADEERLGGIVKNLLRSDADYVIMGEARDGIALDTALRLAGKGTRRMKITFHNREPHSFPFDVADEITRKLGGDVQYHSRRVAASFDYIFHFIQLSDKSQKRLKSIYEIMLERKTQEIRLHEICRYVPDSDSWVWHYHISGEKACVGMEEDAGAFNEFRRTLKKLAVCEGDESGDGADIHSID